ncbi:hypothetical protein Leryth_017005 [Lithospermum erythrorhizon]|nr:hypothetical protein Leryth_017005 [Lithospermum erythrorhizon]
MASSTFSGDETAPFFGFLGAAAALVFSCMGAAYGTAKSGVGGCTNGGNGGPGACDEVDRACLLVLTPKRQVRHLFDGYAHLSSGLACGLAGLSAGMAIGIVGDAAEGYNHKSSQSYICWHDPYPYFQALAPLYGLIVGIILSSRAGQSRAD